MASTALKFCGTGINRPSLANDWNSPGFITADDESDANVDIDALFSSDLLAGVNYSFSGDIATGATIDGVEIEVIDYRNNNSHITWTRLRLILADDTEGAQNRFSDLNSISSVNKTDLGGGPSELWTETITRADVIDADWGFGVGCAGNTAADNVQIDAFRMRIYYTIASDSIALNGSSTIIGATESQIQAGGRTIILDLTGVTWLTAGSAFDATRQTIINIVDSQQVETLGWDNEIKANIGIGQVVRTSDTQVTITLLAAETGDYKIVADEVIDLLSLPATAHSGSTALDAVTSVATITAECDQTLAPDSIATQTNLSGAVTDIDESVDSPDANWLLVA